MKARWSYIQGYLFPWMREDIDPITEALGRLVTALDVIGLGAFVPDQPRGPGPAARGPSRPCPSFRGQGGPGRSHNQRPDRAPRRRQVAASASSAGGDARKFLPKPHFPGRLPNSRAARSRQDPRRADRACARGTHHLPIARDVTEIEARGKPVQMKANDGKEDHPAPDNPAPPRKRGGPRKDEQRPKPELTRLERQVTQNLGQMLADLPTACDVGCKKNGSVSHLVILNFAEGTHPGTEQRDARAPYIARLSAFRPSALIHGRAATARCASRSRRLGRDEDADHRRLPSAAPAIVTQRPRSKAGNCSVIDASHFRPRCWLSGRGRAVADAAV
jgi:hypothetical protein